MLACPAIAVYSNAATAAAQTLHAHAIAIQKYYEKLNLKLLKYLPCEKLQ